MTPAARLLAWLQDDRRRLDVAIAAAVAGTGMFLVVLAPDGTDTGWPEVAAGVGAFVLLAVRRVIPFAALVISLAWLAIHFALWERPTPMFFAALTLLATVCIRLDRRSAIGLGVAIALSVYTLGLLSTDAGIGDARALILVVWTALAVGVADAIRSWRRYRESADAQVRSALLAAEADTRRQVSEERLTIARELHDVLAHSLSVMNVQTGAALHLLRSDPDGAEASLTAARDAGRSVLDELRDLLSVLRDEGDAEPTASLPTIERVDDLVDTMRVAGLDVRWTRTGAPRPLAPAASLAAYRITQEALTNAAKHGDGHVDLATTWDDTGWHLEVANAVPDHRSSSLDADVPSAARRSGHGLVGMRERALANGGRFTSSVGPDRCVITASLPATSAVSPSAPGDGSADLAVPGESGGMP